MRIFAKVDLKLFLPAVFLTIIGGLILSSVAPNAYPQQFVYLALSLLAFLFFVNLDIDITKSLAPFFFGVAVILLAITDIFGYLSHGAVRWLSIGPLSLQPSELAKPALVLFIAWILSRNTSNMRFLWALLAALPAFFLVFTQPDLGSMIVLVAGFLGALFIGGVPVRYMVISAVLCMLAAPLFWTTLEGYQKQRIFTFLNPSEDPLGTGYNSIQSQIAVGSGGLMGRGLGQGTQSQLYFLPERHTDFVFASIGEELGFLGLSLVILAFGFLMFRLITYLKNAEESFSKALYGGVFATFFIQASVNIGMNLGVLPITGIPLPFVSSGGSSLLAMSILLGIVVSCAHSLNIRGNSGIIGY